MINGLTLFGKQTLLLGMISFVLGILQKWMNNMTFVIPVT
uniref:Uncharacterized protein n=1 Tax=Virgibacillus oceani TaxID=1479511 RepID=A0A917M1S2_9BACI|nr:hypothetical protein GCM10011398_15270 [Virgibacillus oceani]